MNTKIVTLLGAATLCCVTVLATTALRDWRTVRVDVTAPFGTDSVNIAGKSFKPADMLSTLMPGKLKNAIAVEADTSGLIVFDSIPGMIMLQTNISTERFAKGNIYVKTAMPMVTLLDGEEIITKPDIDADSASFNVAPVRLEPERSYQLTIRALYDPADSVAPTLAMTYEPDAGFDSIAVVADAEGLRRLMLNDTQYMSRVSGMSMSPDGAYLVTNYYIDYGKERNSRYATLTDLRTRKVVNQHLNEKVRWKPKGHTLYYTIKGADGYDVYTVDPATGAETLAITAVPDDKFYFSPEGRYVYYSKTDEAAKETGPLRRYVTPDDRMPGNRDRSYLMRHDTETGLTQQLTFGNHNTSLLDISADGNNLLVMTMSEDPTVRPFYKSTIYELDANTLKADTIVPAGPQFVENAMFSPDGTKVLLTGSAAAFSGIGQRTGELKLANDFDHQMFIYDKATGKVEPITVEFDPSVEEVLTWDRADGRIYFTVEEGFRKPLYVYDPATRKFTALNTAVDMIHGASVGDDQSRYAAYYGEGATYSARGYLLDLKTGKATLVGDPAAAQLAEVEMGAREPFNFTANDGTEIEGWLTYPPDFDPAKKYPLIVYYYGGTSPTQHRLLQYYTPQLFASRDYVVYTLNPSGTTGYGQEFSARHVNAWGKWTADDIITGVTKLLDNKPFINREKVGAIGASYGGFMTQYLQTLTPLFAAAVSHAGISNVTSYWGEGYWGYSYNSVAAADSYPWNNPELFTKQGSLFNADKINTPLLLLHGTADTNVPIGESIQLFNALRILGKDVEFVSIDGENHQVRDLDKRQLWHNTIMAWFAKYLQDAPQWWDDLYPTKNL